MLPWILLLLLLGIAAGLLWKGWGFYQLGLEARTEHPDYRTLRPSGDLGNGYGFMAALLMLANLLYLVRRRVRAFRWGSMRAWLDVHVFTGLFAAMLAAFHSAFQLRTPIAIVTTVALAVVVLTGLVGRFLHFLVNRGRGGAARAEKILRSWRSVHRLAALTMLVTVGVHIGVAWHFGYRWIFG